MPVDQNQPIIPVPPGPGPAPEPGILTLSNSTISLTPDDPSQLIILTNTGTGNLTLSTIPTPTAPVYSAVTTCSQNLVLQPNQSCVYSIQYSQASNSNSQTLNFTYNDGQSGQTTAATVSWINKLSYLIMGGGGSSGEAKFSKCTIDANNLLTNCVEMMQVSVSGGGGVDGMAFAKINNVDKLFFANPAQFGAVYMCDFSLTTGDASNCNVVTPDSTVTGNPETPRSITFYNAENNTRYAYIASLSANSSQRARNGIYKCDINNSTGQITNCNQTVIPYLYSNVLFDSTENGTKIYYGFYGNNGNGMKVCDVDGAGDIDLGSCVSAGLSVPGHTNYAPNWLEFKYFNNTKYMYINDWYDGVFFQCSVASNNQLENCSNLIDVTNYYGHLQFAFNTVATDNTMLFYPSDFYGQGLPPPISGSNGVLELSASTNGSVMTYQSAINSSSLNYTGNGIRSVIVSP